MALYEAFAKQLREQLRERGWTASSLAQRLEIHRSTVNRWVNAETRPDSVEIVLLIADELGLAGPKRELFLRAYNGEAAEAPAPTPALVATAMPPQTPLESVVPSAHLEGGIPAPVPDFAGRGEELSKLLGIVKSTRGRDVPTMANICGPSGIGKTQLVYVAGRRIAGFFPDGQILLHMRGSEAQPLSPHETLYALVQLLEPQAAIPEDATSLKDYYYHLLQRRRVLIVADDARDAAQIVDLLPPPGSALVVTSRQRFTLPGMTLFDLPPLSAPDAAALLLGICPRVGDDAPALARLCGGLPQALRICGDLLAADRSRSVRRLLEALAADQLRLLQLYAPPGLGLQSIEEGLRLSYLGLDLPAQAVLRQLSIFPGSFDLAAALMIVELPAEGTAGSPAIRSPLEMILSLLYRRSLLDWDQRLERYALQPIVRAFSHMRLEHEALVRLRYARYYAQLAARAAELYDHGGEALQMGLALFDREREHVDVAWRWALGAGGAAPAAGEEAVAGEAAALALMIALATEAIGPLRYELLTELLPLLSASLQVAWQSQDWRAECRLACALSETYRALGAGPRAHAYGEQALAQARRLEDPGLEARAVSALEGAAVLLGG